ncbi:MAG: PTS transporter subunit EIIC [Spirochaetia bacterium]
MTKIFSGLFEVLQRVGRAFMLPIAVLPVAGILLGIGASFTSPQLIDAYGLTWLLPNMPLNYLFTLFTQLGAMVFANLPVIFAVGVAIGLANINKDTAALSALIGFLAFHTVIHVILQWRGLTPETTSIAYMIEGGLSADKAEAMSRLYTRVLGIFTLEVGVLGGIICGIVAAMLTNRFSQIVLPDILSFFNGSRFVPLTTMLTFIPLGAIFPLFWPVVFEALVNAGMFFAKTGGIGALLYATSMRMLNVLGLHHAIYPLFWYTPLGGTMEVQGQLVSGGQNIFFAQLADPSTTHFNREATKTMTGGFLPMMFGLPAAAYAMYQCAEKENRQAVKGLFLSAGLTSFLTGITEPLEFTFLFVAFPLYVIHAILEGISYMLLYLLNVTVGITFSRGIIDFTFFGLLQGNAKTGYMWILLLGPLYAVAYYTIFRFMILKFNYATPGRGGAENRLYHRADFEKKKNTQGGTGTVGLDDPILGQLLEAFGGRSNIAGLDACITRLRVTVKDESLVADDTHWRELGAQGVIRSGKGIQVIYGAKAEVYKNQLREKYEL